MIDRAIADLVRYAQEKELIAPEDQTWAVNSLLEILKLDSYSDPGPSREDVDLPAVLDKLLGRRRIPRRTGTEFHRIQGSSGHCAYGKTHSSSQGSDREIPRPLCGEPGKGHRLVLPL